jgi:hypothetical protein
MLAVVTFNNNISRQTSSLRSKVVATLFYVNNNNLIL